MFEWAETEAAGALNALCKAASGGMKRKRIPSSTSDATEGPTMLDWRPSKMQPVGKGAACTPAAASVAYPVDDVRQRQHELQPQQTQQALQSLPSP